MALSANTVIEVRLTGSDTNGGGFVTGAAGTDWSQQDSAQYAVTDGVANGTTTLTSATANFGTDVVGNLVYAQGGSGSIAAGWYQIVSRTNATTIVVDRSTGLTAGTGVTLKIGGALASPGQAAALATVAGMTTFIKYNVSPYVATTASTNVSGGCVSGATGTAYVGYDTTRAMFVRPVQANRPTFQLGSGVTSAILFTGVNNAYFLQSIILDANNQTGSKCTLMSGHYFYVKGMNGVAAGLTQNSPASAYLCEVTGCAAVPFQIQTAFWCVAHDNTLTSPTNFGAFQGNNAYSLFGCIAYNNNCDGFASYQTLNNCVAYGNAGHGFDVVNQAGSYYTNCIAENNGLYGYRTNAGYCAFLNCADYNNTSGRSISSSGGKIWGDIDPISGTASFFNNAASQDFTLNNSAGGGALLRGAAFPLKIPVPLNNNYLDLGALQHQDAGGASGPVGRFISAQRGTPY